MSKKVTLEIDGKTVEAEEEATVLKAAEDAGIKIPTLCYDKQMEPYGACRLCIVEVTRNNRKRTVVSCTYPVEEGIKVETNSDKIRKLRKTLIEEMIPLAPTSGPLNSLAEEYGADKKRFKGEASDCVLCGLCVRYCASVNKTPAVTFVGRGTERRIAFVPEIAPSECPSCQKCYNLCPAGKIIEGENQDVLSKPITRAKN